MSAAAQATSAAAALLLVTLLIPVTVVAADDGSASTTIVPTARAVDEIPEQLYELYVGAADTAACDRLPWTVLAAMAAVGSDHGRAVPDVASGRLGLTAMPQATWDAYRTDADRDRVADAHDPEDNLAAAAHVLCSNGGDDPAALPTALAAFDTADGYSDRVLAVAARYGFYAFGQDATSGAAAFLLDNPRVQLSAAAAADITSGRMDPRVLSILALIAVEQPIAVSVLKTGHSKHVAGTTAISNHWCYQAADIWRIGDATVSRGNHVARAVVEWILSWPLDHPLRPDEVGHPWEELEPIPSSFSDGMHHGHVHIGYGPRCEDQ